MNGKTGRLFVFRAFFVSESVLKNKKTNLKSNAAFFYCKRNMNSPLVRLIDLWSKRGLGVILEVFIKSSNRFKKKKKTKNNHQELFLYSILKTVYLNGNYNKHIYTSVLCGFSFLSDRQAQTSVSLCSWFINSSSNLNWYRLLYPDGDK